MKYNGQIDLSASNSSHTKLLLMIPPDSKVLDVGCANGFFSQALLDRGCEVVGIEKDLELAAKAERRGFRVLQGDVEEPDLLDRLAGERFDVIVCGDLLEHLVRPGEVLRRFHEFLKEDGFLAASIPNVAHGSVRLSLLKGRFDRRPEGLLDETHMHFFTRETMQMLFEKSGYLITSLDRVLLEVKSTEIPVEGRLGAGAEAPKFPDELDSLTYQFIVKAIPCEGAGRMAQLAEEARGLRETLIRAEEQLSRLKASEEENQKALDDRNQEIARLRNLMAEKEVLFQRLTGELRGKDALLREKDALLRGKDALVECLEKDLEWHRSKLSMRVYVRMKRLFGLAKRGDQEVP